MLSKVKSFALLGVNGYMINVETDIFNGLPGVDIVGLADTAVKEARERVKSAVKNSGFDFPVSKIVINLAPASTRKDGAFLDLPIAIGILTAMGILKQEKVDEYIFIGELSLDGTLRWVPGILPMVLEAYELGYKNFVLPLENAPEAAIVSGINVWPFKNLKEIYEFLSGYRECERYVDTGDAPIDIYYDVDFSEVKGQEIAKRGLEIAAAGGHNLLMVGPPGTGKTMLARRLPTILPDLTFEESLEVTKIYSAAGLLKGQSLIKTRPFRTPHHTISSVSLVGGGTIPKPGEVSLAHHGVLFLDEMPEFKRDALEALRQPMEDRKVTISRVNATISYPSDFLLLGSSNPTPCGYYPGDPYHICRCTPVEIKRYQNRISGPIRDRIDIFVDVDSIEFENLLEGNYAESSKDIKLRIDKARFIQLERYRGLKILNNSQIKPSMFATVCRLNGSCRKLMKEAYDKFHLSARSYNRILKVARTIADLDGSPDITDDHLLEALAFRETRPIPVY
ncbi:MAG: YifB family Mg chelatase-like AAA ATPase [Thermoanaerobacteraceae bacterium]|nr:YifB family Mg chelatase-like AAA ATPase [Thermoanaerobacteraceae bacterium]